MYDARTEKTHFTFMLFLNYQKQAKYVKIFTTITVQHYPFISDIKHESRTSTAPSLHVRKSQ
jgi:hypothetical protein